jgi:hypothetical protein
MFMRKWSRIENSSNSLEELGCSRDTKQRLGRKMAPFSFPWGKNYASFYADER